MTETRVAGTTTCARCDGSNPDVAHFCARCGADLHARTERGRQRRDVYAAHPGEPVASVNVVSSLMPLAAGKAPQTYRWARALGLAIPILAALLGMLPFALAAAALSVPVVYVLYLHDVNQWEDQPLPVLAAAVALAGMLALGFTLLWRDRLLGGALAFRTTANGYFVDSRTLLVIGLVVPVIAVLLTQLGPLWLISRRRFDDVIDALTFGVAAGAAFAAVETLVLTSSVLFDGPFRVHSPNAGAWVSLVVVAGFVKPVVYGSAAGIACAAFSGAGEGHTGFGPRYARGVGEAIAAVAAFQIGLYLTGRLGGTVGIVLGVMWALLVAGALLVRVRHVLHTALLDGGLEAAAAHSVPASASRGVGFCGECGLPLVHDASFCVSCGTSVRAASKLTRRANTESGSTGVEPTTVTWHAGADAARSARRSPGVLIGIGLVVIALAGGVFAATNSVTRPGKSHVRLTAPDASTSRAGARGRSRPASFGEQMPDPSDLTPGVALNGGIEFALPPDWTLVENTDEFAILARDGALFRVMSNPTDIVESPEARLQKLADDLLSAEVQDLEGQIATIDPPSAAIVLAAELGYTGAIVTDIESVAVEGYAQSWITEDGWAISFDYLNRAGETEAMVADYAEIYLSILESLGPGPSGG